MEGAGTGVWMEGAGGGVRGRGYGWKGWWGWLRKGLDGGGRWRNKEEGGDPRSDSFFKTLFPWPLRYGAFPPPWRSPCYRLGFLCLVFLSLSRL